MFSRDDVLSRPSPVPVVPGALGCLPGAETVALNVIREELAADPEFRTRFTRGVAAARRVEGRFTAAVVDADLDGPRPWVATAYVPGPPLGRLVAQRGPLPDLLLLAPGPALAEGLREIRPAGVVHRDLQPSNVILGSDGPQIVDFGIAVTVESAESARYLPSRAAGVPDRSVP